jgi:flavin-binding protein dodecin
MAVHKAVDLIGEGTSVENAVQEALDRAGLSLEGITSFTVERITGRVDTARLVYRVELKVWFTLLERIHA